jgi:hypothetical protein
MESLEASQVRRWAVLAAVAVLAAGCVNLASLVPDSDGPPTGAVCRVAPIWNPQVMFTPDPTRNGMPIPGVAGRLFLFGPQYGFPLSGEGSVVVDLFDPARADGKGTEIPLEEWRIDKDTLKRLQVRDDIGWGYTLFLPWSTYRPDLTRVEIRTRFDPVKGSPLYADPAAMTFNQGLSKPTITANHKDVALPKPGEPLPPPPPDLILSKPGVNRPDAAPNSSPIVITPDPSAKRPSAAN